MVKHVFDLSVYWREKVFMFVKYTLNIAHLELLARLRFGQLHGLDWQSHVVKKEHVYMFMLHKWCIMCYNNFKYYVMSSSFVSTTVFKSFSYYKQM